MTITPKNWHDFQHYKDRRPAWIKLHRGILDDYEFSCLPLGSRALAPMLWLLASEYEDGKITASLDALAFRLRTKRKDFEDALNPLIEHGFFISDGAPLAPRKPDAGLERERQDKTEKDSCRASAATNDDFDEFWKAKPRRKGDNPKAPAKKLFQSLVRAGAVPAEIIAGAREWTRNNTEKIDTEFIPQAVKWLRDRRWEDYAAVPYDPEKLEKQNAILERHNFIWDEASGKLIKKDAA